MEELARCKLVETDITQPTAPCEMTGLDAIIALPWHLVVLTKAITNVTISRLEAFW